MHSPSMAKIARTLPMKTTILCVLLPLALFGCTASPQTNDNVSRRPVAESSPDPLAGIAPKTVRDIEQRVAQVAKNGGNESLARAIAEIDEWLFAPEEEKQADQLIEKLVADLRGQIEKEVAAFSKAAVDASNGKLATDNLSKINLILALYPAPKTDDQRARLDQIVASIRSASRRVEDIRRLRYNTWAISQMESGLWAYYMIKKIIRTDEDALIKACINSMKTIDPAYLDPAALDIYNYVLGLARNAVGEKFRIALAKGLADPATQRRTPMDF